MLPFEDYSLYQESYRPAGDQAPVLVFLHDSLGCTELWRDFPLTLAAAAGANVFLYDRRGYGRSDPFDDTPRTADYMEKEAEILMQVLEKNGISMPVLFGHSDGGTIALLAAALYPGNIKAVITEGAHVFVEDITLDGIERASEQYAVTNLKERLEKYHGDKTQALFEAWTETWLAPWYRNWNIEHRLPQITCPVLVIQGEEDEFGSTAQVQAIAGQTGGTTRAFLVPLAGHSPHKQSGHWITEQCCRFLRDNDII